MFHRVTVRVLAVVMCGWLLATDAGALSLGRVRGAALIGRALDVSIPVTLDGKEPDNPCASAEVYYGDTRVHTATVRWQATGPSEGTVRVLADAAVDEPTVTIYLHAGCAQANTRKFVLLAEPVPVDEPAARLQAARPPAISLPAVSAAGQAAALASAAAAPLPAAPGAGSPRRRNTDAAAPIPAPSAQARPGPRAKAAAPRPRRAATPEKQPRLHLEPLDLTVDRDPTLRLSPELSLPAAIDAQQRSGFAALWQALQKDPQQQAQDALRVQRLERELDSVRDTGRQNAEALTQMRGQVEQAQGDRKLAALLVTALGIVLALLLAWMAWRWYRVRQLERVGHWFDLHGETVQAHLPTTPEAARGVHVAAPAVAAAPALALAGKASSPAPVPSALLTASPPRTSSWGGGEEFQASRGGTVRTVGVQELIDVHDKADFFLSIGEIDQAVAVLDTHVHDQVETGALAWLDLLELYHSLGKRAEFERLRIEFRQRYTVQVPDFAHFDEPTASLENYSRALSRIVAMWPSRRVLDVIEESIFRKPGQAGAEPFSLEAYRELVLLYHVAKEMVPEEQPRAAPAAGPSLPVTLLQPQNMLDRPEEPPLSPQEKLMIPPPSARLGVDIDLDLDADAEADSEMKPLDFDISSFDTGRGPEKAKGA